MVASKWKMLPTIRKPLSLMHRILTGQGFAAREQEDGLTYQAKVKDSSSHRTFLLTIPARSREDGWTDLYMTEARFEEAERVPKPVTEAAISKLKEIADYLQSENRMSS